MNITTEQQILAATSAIARLTAEHHRLGDAADAPGHTLPATIVDSWAAPDRARQHEALAGAIRRGWVKAVPGGYCLTMEGLSALEASVPRFRMPVHRPYRARGPETATI